MEEAAHFWGSEPPKEHFRGERAGSRSPCSMAGRWTGRCVEAQFAAAAAEERVQSAEELERERFG